MLSALSNIYGTAHQVKAGRPQADAARTESAVAALAALSPAQPLPSVSDPFEDNDEAFSFLYRPNGLPSGRDMPATLPQAVAGNTSPSRLDIESSELSSLLSSLMTPSSEAGSAVAQPATDAAVPPVQDTLIAKLYRQF